MASLALSVDDKRPLLLTLPSPRGGAVVPRSPCLCGLAYSSVTLENSVQGCYSALPGGLLSEGGWSSWTSEKESRDALDGLVAPCLSHSMARCPGAEGVDQPGFLVAAQEFAGHPGPDATPSSRNWLWVRWVFSTPG